MRHLNKKVWPYSYTVKTEKTSSGSWQDANENEMEAWLWEKFSDNIKDRLYVVTHYDSHVYNFKREDDYKWFIWRWA